MATYINYDESGAIRKVVTTTITMDGENSPGMLYVATSPDPTTQFVSDGAIVNRPENPAVLDGLTLTNVPVPSKLYIDGAEYDVPEDNVTLNFPDAGTYKIRLVCFPYVDLVFEIMK